MGVVTVYAKDTWGALEMNECVVFRGIFCLDVAHLLVVGLGRIFDLWLGTHVLSFVEYCLIFIDSVTQPAVGYMDFRR